MANLAETDVWETAIYQLEQIDFVQAGVGGTGISNKQGLQLANRTGYLYGKTMGILNGTTPSNVLQPMFDVSAQFATDAFVIFNGGRFTNAVRTNTTTSFGTGFFGWLATAGALIVADALPDAAQVFTLASLASLPPGMAIHFKNESSYLFTLASSSSQKFVSPINLDSGNTGQTTVVVPPGCDITVVRSQTNSILGTGIPCWQIIVHKGNLHSYNEGGYKFSSVIAANTSLTLSSYGSLYVATTISTGQTFTLPAISSVPNSGMGFVIKNDSSNPFTLTAAGSDNLVGIELDTPAGQTSVVLNPGAVIGVIYDLIATAWRIVLYEGNLHTWVYVGVGGAPAFNNSWTNYSTSFGGAGFGDVRYRKNGNYLEINGTAFFPTTISTFVFPIFTLPLGLRPKNHQFFPNTDMQGGSLTPINNIFIKSDGTVNFNNFASQPSAIVSFNFIIPLD